MPSPKDNKNQKHDIAVIKKEKQKIKKEKKKIANQGVKVKRPVDKLMCPLALRIATCHKFASSNLMQPLKDLSRDSNVWSEAKKCISMGINSCMKMLEKPNCLFKLLLIDSGLNCNVLLQHFVAACSLRKCPVLLVDDLCSFLVELNGPGNYVCMAFKFVEFLPETVQMSIEELISYSVPPANDEYIQLKSLRESWEYQPNFDEIVVATIKQKDQQQNQSEDTGVHINRNQHSAVSECNKKSKKIKNTDSIDRKTVEDNVKMPDTLLSDQKIAEVKQTNPDKSESDESLEKEKSEKLGLGTSLETPTVDTAVNVVTPKKSKKKKRKHTENTEESATLNEPEPVPSLESRISEQLLLDDFKKSKQSAELMQSQSNILSKKKRNIEIDFQEVQGYPLPLQNGVPDLSDSDRLSETGVNENGSSPENSENANQFGAVVANREEGPVSVALNENQNRSETRADNLESQLMSAISNHGTTDETVNDVSVDNSLYSHLKGTNKKKTLMKEKFAKALLTSATIQNFDNNPASNGTSYGKKKWMPEERKEKLKKFEANNIKDMKKMDRKVKKETLKSAKLLKKNLLEQIKNPSKDGGSIGSRHVFSKANVIRTIPN